MKKIKLTQGKFALVDDEDFEYLNQFKWCYLPKQRTVGEYGYAVRNSLNRKRIFMHNAITIKKNGLGLDHKDRNGLNNQKENLRLATRSQNNANMVGHGKTSRFKGIYLRKTKNKNSWFAEICYKYVRYYLGTFQSEKEAAKAYDLAAKKLFGEFARLNFA